MPESLLMSGANGMPVWDSFEALFFAGAGFFVGIVLGVLFPSLWRTFRRRFRKSLPPFSWNRHWNNSVMGPAEVFTTMKSFSTSLPTVSELSVAEGEEEARQQESLRVAALFVQARYHFQNGKMRESARLYIEILNHEEVSGYQTSLALFELSHVYFRLGLVGKALDIAVELLGRKPTDNILLEHALNLCCEGYLSIRVPDILDLFRGAPSSLVRLVAAHALCQAGESELEKDDGTKALEFARTAVRWQRKSGRALIFLWRAAGGNFWRNSQTSDSKAMWAAFATDLEALARILTETSISPAAAASHLAGILIRLANAEDAITSFPLIQKEFEAASGRSMLSRVIEKKLQTSIFHAVLLVRVSIELKKTNVLPGVLAILGSSFEWFLSVREHEEAIRLGYSSHVCEKCGGFYDSFYWYCRYCGSRETLLPALIPSVVGESYPVTSL